MSNGEAHPDLVLCKDAEDGPIAQVLEPRMVPLGGIRAMTVRRTLPQRSRSLIGAWCFVDHYGPDDVAETGGMEVPGHPHTGLQTVTWLFTGEVEHRDSLGTLGMVRPGEVNLMTSGSGIAHSEYSTPETTTLHGVQLWVALPDHARFTDRAFENYRPEPIDVDGSTLRVFLGELEGSRSPVHTWTRLLGAEVTIPAGRTVTLHIDPDFEHGILVDSGTVHVDGIQVHKNELAYLSPGAHQVILGADAAEDAGQVAEDARLILLGGVPFGEEIVMWWNFIGRSHDEIVAFRDAWQEQIAEKSRWSVEGAPYGSFPEVWDKVLPAPEMPATRLRPRA